MHNKIGSLNKKQQFTMQENDNDFFDVEIMRPRPITTDNDQLADGKPADTGGYQRKTGGYRRIVKSRKQKFLNICLRMNL